MELIEREQQLRKLTEAWNQVRAGKGCIALVSGEAGIGKTSLIERFAAEQRKSARVLWGSCDDLFSPQPLGPFIDIAIQLASDLLRSIQGGADRLAISTQLLLELQKNPAPTIMILEDLHWADEATLDVVKFLGRRVQLTKTLLVLSYRDDEVNSQHPLHFLLGDFPPHLSFRIPIPRLSRGAVSLLAQRSGRQADDLYLATGGNPFFVSEVIAAGGEGLPTSVRDAVLARAARLSRPAKDIVELAALMPGAAELWLLEQILHPDPAALDECIERGILRSKEETLAFRHELARQAVESSLPMGKTRDLHTKILKLLLERDGEAIPFARLVHHAVRAGDERATLQYAPTAAWQASALGAHREAAALYQTALSFAHYLPAAERAELLEDLSFENYIIDRVDEALRAREQAMVIWEKLKNDLRAGDCQRWLSRLHWSLGNKKEAERHADQAIAILSQQPEGAELAMAFSNKSQLHMLAWEEAPAIEWGQRAMELAEKLGDMEILVHALTNVGSIETLQDVERGNEKIIRALRIAREHEMHEHAARCYANLSSNAVRSREFAEAQRWLDEGLEYILARDLDYYSVYLLGWQAQMSLDTGRWAEAELQGREAMRLSQHAAITSLPATIALGHLKARQGEPEAGELLERAYSVALPSGELQRIGPVAAARGELAWWQGDIEGVAAAIAPAYELALHRNDPWVFGEVAYWMCRTGKEDVPAPRAARPYALMIEGEWQAAAREWERIGCPFERALALAEGNEAARKEALAIFEGLGARPAAGELRRRLQEQGVKNIPREARPVRADTLDELTPREWEVLRLIAEGLSNPDIAERLTVSVGTVKAHTANIYGKLGAKNRVQALSRARELHLL